MKLVQIAGYLGSGKTTLGISLGKSLSEAGEKVALIVNDMGSVSVDGKVMADYGLIVKEIGGGCICCEIAGNLLMTLEMLAKGANPGLVILEPTGVAVPGTVSEIVLAIKGKSDINLGPVIVLFDTTRAEELLGYDGLDRLITRQLRDADIIALSKVEMVSKDDVERCAALVRQLNPKAEVVELSTRTGEGLERLEQAVTGTTVRT